MNYSLYIKQIHSPQSNVINYIHTLYTWIYTHLLWWYSILCLCLFWFITCQVFYKILFILFYWTNFLSFLSPAFPLCLLWSVVSFLPFPMKVYVFCLSVSRPQVENFWWFWSPMNEKSMKQLWFSCGRTYKKFPMCSFLIICGCIPVNFPSLTLSGCQGPPQVQKFWYLCFSSLKIITRNY